MSGGKRELSSKDGLTVNDVRTNLTGTPRSARKKVAAPASEAVSVSVYKSAVELRPEGLFRGWVYNPKNTTEQPLLTLFVDDAECGSTTADQPEPKLNIDDKNHRFWLPIPPAYHDGLPHAYRIEIAGSGQLILQRSATFTLEASPPPPPPPVRQSTDCVQVKSGWFRGYARDELRPEDRHVVCIHVDGSFVGYAVADEDRSDVFDERQGHFFSFPVPFRFWDGRPHAYIATIDGRETPLSPAAATFLITAPKGLFGEVESLSNGCLTGWVASSEGQTGPFEVMLRVDGTVGARRKTTAEASVFRLADGSESRRHTFSLTVPEDYIDGEIHSFAVHIGDKTLTARSPIGSSFRLTRPSTKAGPDAIRKIENKSFNFQESEILYDIVFVVNINSKGWILEKICQRIAAELNLSAYFAYPEKNDSVSAWLPKARSYFFGHYKLLAGALKSGADIWNASRYVWFTHPVFDAHMSRDALHSTLVAADHVFTANSKHRDALVFLGLEESRVSAVIGGADPDLFRSKLRAGRGVGIVGAYYERKNPDLVLALAKAMPETPFLLLAPTADEVENKLLLWTHWPRLDEFVALENVRYVEAPYSEFPDYYDEFDIYLSVSKLEGGPIPLIEAMFANCVPVVTNTGFAEDVVTNGVNGYIVPLSASEDEFIAKLKSAIENDVDVRATVEHLTWSGFGHQIASVISPPINLDEEVDLRIGAGRQMRIREGWLRQDAGGALMGSGGCRLSLPVDDPATSVLLQVEVENPRGVALSLSADLDRRRAEPQPLAEGLHMMTFEFPKPTREDEGSRNLVLRAMVGVPDAPGSDIRIRVRNLTLQGALP